jgi:Glycosyl transferase family 2
LDNRSLLKRALWGIEWRYRYKWHPAASDNVRGYAALVALAYSWRFRKLRKPHGLPGELVVSLTSYQPRFRTLVYTLRCLLSQTVRADRTILWLADDDAPAPAEISELCQYGLEIRYTKNIRSYKKIIPSLTSFPEAFIVTADDDAYYAPQWLEHLVKAWDRNHYQVVCHVARQITVDHIGSPRPYQEWTYASAPKTSASLLPIGVGGVLYPPGSLHPEVLDEQTFLEVCPSGDDLWLYWMGRRNMTIYKKIGGPNIPPNWPTSQRSSLFHENVVRSKNDEQIEMLITRFGLPDLAQSNQSASPTKAERT